MRAVPACRARFCAIGLRVLKAPSFPCDAWRPPRAFSKTQRIAEDGDDGASGAGAASFLHGGRPASACGSVPFADPRPPAARLSFAVPQSLASRALSQLRARLRPGTRPGACLADVFLIQITVEAKGGASNARSGAIESMAADWAVRSAGVCWHVRAGMGIGHQTNQIFCSGIRFGESVGGRQGRGQNGASRVQGHRRP